MQVSTNFVIVKFAQFDLRFISEYYSNFNTSLQWIPFKLIIAVRLGPTHCSSIRNYDVAYFGCQRRLNLHVNVHSHLRQPAVLKARGAISAHLLWEAVQGGKRGPPSQAIEEGDLPTPSPGACSAFTQEKTRTSQTIYHSIIFTSNAPPPLNTTNGGYFKSCHEIVRWLSPMVWYRKILTNHRMICGDY